MSKDSKQNTNITIDSIQKIFLYILICILPISILPFPWDITEKGVSIVILGFTTVIFALELVKIIWSGKFLFLKRSSDLVIFSLFVALVLTTIFSSDSNLSVFGYNYRFSAGLIGIGSILLITFLTRSFIQQKRDIANLIQAFLVGSILTSFLSLVSLFGGNILNAIPQISSLSQIGFPIIGAPVVLVIYNCVAILLGRLSLEIYNESEVGDNSWFSIIAIIVNIVSLLIFSFDSISLITILVFFLLWLLVTIIILGKDKLSVKSKITQLLIPSISIILVLLMQFDSISNLFLKNIEILSPLNLSIDASWQIVSQSLMSSLKDGIFGRGLDSFATVFNSLKPINLTNFDLVNGFNEIFTSLSNAGFLWLVIWFVLGWFLLKDLFIDIKSYTKDKKELILLDTLSLFIFLTSLLTTYTGILRFVFFFVISLSVIYRSILNTQDVDSLLLKMWTMGTSKKDEKSTPSISIFLTILIGLISLLLLVRLGSITISSLYILRAESYIIDENAKYSEVPPTLDQRDAFVENLYHWYKEALRYDKNNPLTNRKFSLIAIDKMDIAFSKYKETEDDEILNSVVLLRNEAFEYSKTAINLSPSLYSSYNNRALIYMGLINLGYSDYIRDGISALQDAIDLKPLDYQNYYNMAQLYYLMQDYDLALEASTQSLTINGAYIPSLILSAKVNGIQERTEVQISYLEAAKTILETNGQQNLDLYSDVVKQIEDIKNFQEDGEATLEDIDSEVSLETEQ
jgi:tetratricopeptide (TPR) repeat protein